MAPSSHFATMREETVNSLKMNEEVLKDPGSLHAIESPKEPWGLVRWDKQRVLTCIPYSFFRIFFFF